MPQLAFPGAEGFGAYTVGGRTGTPNCYIVDTTADNSDAPVLVVGTTDTYTSSFRMACKASGPRFVVFETGGTCTLTIDDPDYNTGVGCLLLNSDNLTILGGTAPGGGFAVQGNVRAFANQIIIRHIRFRGGSDFVTSDPFSLGRISPRFQNCILDHCSISWGEDNPPSGIGYDHWTMQDCIWGPTFLRGALYNDDVGAGSMLRNLQYQNGFERLPWIQNGPGGYEIINNVIATKKTAVKTMISAWHGEIHVNHIGNSVLLLDPDSVATPQSPGSYFVRPVREYGEAYMTSPSRSLPGQAGLSAISSVHYSDNYDEYFRPLGTEPEEDCVWVQDDATDALPRLGAPIDFSGDSDYVAPTVLSSSAARTSVLASATGSGAWQHRDANAAFTSTRDSHDTTIITNMGFDPVRGMNYPTSDDVADIADAGGLPTLAAGTPLGAAFDGSQDNGGIPSAYTLPTGATWSTVVNSPGNDAHGYNFLEVYAYEITRYWDSSPINKPFNVITSPFTVVAGTSTTLNSPTQLSVEATDENIDHVQFTSVSNTAVLKVGTTTGVTLKRLADI